MPKLCQFENCRNRATYAEFYGIPIRCNTHRDNLYNQYRICHCGNKFPTFNYNGLKAEYCVNCKLDGMIDVKSKKCKCNRARPSFNFEGLVPEYCANCKLDGMIDIKSKKCKCNNSQPTFNFAGLKPEYCSKCKLDEMIDLKHKKCYCGLARPTYNYKGLKAEYCANCKLDEMIDVNHNKCSCGLARPSYNLKGLEPICCVTCKTTKMIDVVNKKCKANYCLGSLGNSKYKGYCSSCYQQLFPNDPLTFQIRSKTKEIAVRDFINKNFVGFQHDKPLWTGNCECVNRRRIDHRILIGNTMLCIETDENQHKNYNAIDAEIRYDDLYMLHSGKFIFIRFNPDKYKNTNGKTVNPMLYTRLPVLQIEIEKQIQRINEDKNTELLEIIKLYYDNYD
jgi:hypothetical protein